MKLLFRIYTEDVNRDNIILACRVLESYTLIACSGNWQGSEEQSLVIEVIGDHGLALVIDHVAYMIKSLNNQQTVLVTSQTLLKADFI